jgi:hypothetical protein
MVSVQIHADKSNRKKPDEHLSKLRLFWHACPGRWQGELAYLGR